MTFRSQTLNSCLLAIFIYLCTVGLLPFGQRAGLATTPEATTEDIVRQAAIAGTFMLVAMQLLWRCPRRIATALPAQFWLVLGWCAVTLIWSPVPAIGARRLALTIVVVATVFLLVRQLGVDRAFRVAGATLITLTLASLASAAVAPGAAFHQPADPERAVVGSLRGLFYHKNILGVVAAAATIFATHIFVQRRRMPHLMLLLGCVSTLWLSSSKTSIGLTAIAVVFMAYTASAQRHRFLRQSAGMLAFAAASLMTLALIPPFLGDELVAISEDAFTGRGEIWKYVAMVFSQNPLQGAGFASIFQVGAQSPLTSTTNGNWVTRVPHAHNGYLEVAASVGLIGLALLALAIGAVVARGVVIMSATRPRLLPPVLSLLVFALAHNMLESGLLDRTDATWMLVLLSLGLLSSAARAPAPETLRTESGSPIQSAV
jgi:exopolysaccharide production protein ExoQ